MSGLRVGQAFGMFLLPGFGVGSSSPWVPGHPTSMCDSGVNVSKCKLKKHLFGEKNKRKIGEFCYSMTTTFSPLVA